MDEAELALRKEEYYELLAGSESLRAILNERGGIVLARAGGHPPWPARFSEPGEFAKLARHRAKKGQACVYFFGSHNYGWVPKSSLLPFTEKISTFKASKRKSQMIQEALDEAKMVLDNLDETSSRFFDRIMEQRVEDIDLPCELCNRVDDHFSLLILCDGKDCRREYHMNCLSPPLVTVPPGKWFCPNCREKNTAVVDELATESRPDRSPHGKEGASTGKSTGPRKPKKEKVKTKSVNHKRRLSSTSPDPEKPTESASSSKKSRANRSSSREPSPASAPTPIEKDQTPPPKKAAAKLTHAPSSEHANGSGPGKSSSGSKRPPHIEIPKARGHSTSEADNVSADENVPSEERCLVCGFGGELVVCEFQGCTKVYHQFCLGSFPFPKDDEAVWFCPRHTCALTGRRESVREAAKFASPKKLAIKNLLWKCSLCPVAIADAAMPHVLQTQVFSKKQRRFLCPHCAPNAPFKIQLGKLLEKIWSTMATNRQGVPFCGPLLCGLEYTDDRRRKSAKKSIDLFKVLAKIRRLEYNDSSAFVADIGQIVQDAEELVGRRSEPLAEAARTMKIICDEQMEIHREKIGFLDGKLRRPKGDTRSKSRKDSSPESKECKPWPLRWRQECGPFEDKFYPRLEARTLDEWEAHVTAAPLYVTSEGMEDPDADCRVDNKSDQDEDSTEMLEDVDHAVNEADGGQFSGRAPTDMGRLSFPGLTLSEGADVVLALGELSRSSGDHQARHFGMEQGPNGLEGLDGRDIFLSPSTSEMQQMFDQQSALLRSALESHSVLQHSWRISQQELIGLGNQGELSVGEGRLAAELRLANKNLRQRLRNKDRLVDQLMSDQMALRSEVAALQRQVSHANARVLELEGRLVDASHSATESQLDMSDSRTLSEGDDEDFTGSERLGTPQ